MSLLQLVARRSPVLAEGSIYELLRRDPRIELDPQVAHAGLIYDDVSRKLLAAIHTEYADVAARHDLPLLALTDTWRASGQRVAASPFAGRNVNADNVAFLRGLLSGRNAFVAGLTGPAADAYRPHEAPSYGQAVAYHAAQVGELAAAGVDLLFAATLPSTTEARAIGVLMSRTQVPWTLSFVIRASGEVLDGVPLAEAIETIDAATAEAPPVGYSINCVHSTTAAEAALALPPHAARRLIIFQGNASRLSPEELDGRSGIDSEPADAYAEAVMQLLSASGIPVAGGCCGTSPAHLEALAARIAAGR